MERLKYADVRFHQTPPTLIDCGPEAGTFLVYSFFQKDQSGPTTSLNPSAPEFVPGAATQTSHQFSFFYYFLSPRRYKRDQEQEDDANLRIEKTGN